jgi:hypothetical protein
VQLKDIDIIGAELPQRIVEALHRASGGGAAVAPRDPRFGGDHHPVARNAPDRLADHGLGAVDRGGVEQIDPQVERFANESDRLGLALAGPEAEPAEAAAAEAGDADLEAGAPERDIFHQRKPIDSHGIAATMARATTSAPI